MLAEPVTVIVCPIATPVVAVNEICPPVPVIATEDNDNKNPILNRSFTLYPNPLDTIFTLVTTFPKTVISAYAPKPVPPFNGWYLYVPLV